MRNIGTGFYHHLKRSFNNSLHLPVGLIVIECNVRIFLKLVSIGLKFGDLS